MKKIEYSFFKKIFFFQNFILTAFLLEPFASLPTKAPHWLLAAAVALRLQLGLSRVRESLLQQPSPLTLPPRAGPW
jgi:hypothetical protein